MWYIGGRLNIGYFIEEEKRKTYIPWLLLVVGSANGNLIGEENMKADYIKKIIRKYDEMPYKCKIDDLVSVFNDEVYIRVYD